MCSVNNGIGSGLTKVVNLHVNGKSSQYLKQYKFSSGLKMCNGCSKHLSIFRQVQPYFVGGESQIVSLTLGRAHEVICEAVSSSPVNIAWSKGNNVFTNVAANR